MQLIRIGLVGLGIMGRRYYRMLQDLEGVKVTTLCVRYVDTIQDLPETKFADYRQLCASGLVDAVLIATPHYSHPQIAIGGAAVGAGSRGHGFPGAEVMERELLRLAIGE